MIQHDSLVAVCADRGFQAVGLLVVWATLLLGCAWLIAVLLRRASAAVRYCVWQYALMGLLVVPSVFAVLPGIPLGLLLTGVESISPGSDARLKTGAATDVGAPSFDPTVGARSFATDAPIGPKRSSLSTKSSAEEERIPTPSLIERPDQRQNAVQTPARNRAAIPGISWSAALIGVWALGVAAQLAWLVWCVARAGRLVRAAETVEDLQISKIQGELQRQFSLLRPVRLLRSAAMRAPLVTGVRRPSILLPAGCAYWPVEKVRIVLSHELAHVERRDVFWQLAARTAAALYWFHPLAWLAMRRMRQERERACDDRVLSVGVPAIDYAAGLAEFAASLAGRAWPLAGSLGMAEQLPLEDRVRSILDGSVCRRPASKATRGILLAASLCLVLLLGALRPFTAAPRAAADDVPKSDGKAPAADTPKAETKTAAPAAEPAPPTAESAEREPKQLPTKGSMLVRVVGPDGEPLAGAKLFANVSSWNRNTDWTKHWTIKNDNYATGDDGSVEIKLPPVVEDLRLWASNEGYVRMFAIWWPKRQSELKAIPDEFTYHLQKGTRLGGFIKNDAGEPVEGAKIEVSYEGNGLRAKPNQAVFDSWLSSGDDAVRTDAQGRWRLDNVPPGDDIEVRLKLSHPDYIDDNDWGQLQKEQHVTLKSLRDETAVIAMHQGSVLTGTVTDPDGRPVKGAVVIWGDRPYWQEGSQEVRTDEQGAYLFPPLPPGKMHVTVVAQGWMPERTDVVIVSHRHTQPVNFRLKPGKKLRIRFVDQSGASVSRVAVQIATWHGAESLYNHKHSNVLDTNIPRMSDENGVYEWNWAPDSPVEFNFGREGFANGQASLTADDSEQVVTLFPRLRFAGTVVDVATGRPIEHFAAVPIIHFREDFPSVEHQEAVPCAAGKFSMDFDRPDVEHSLQIEAPGYATVRTDAYPIGAKVPPLVVHMKPAPRFVGLVIDESGRPVANARVYVGSFSEHLYLHDFETDAGGRDSNYRVKTNGQGEFEFAHQLERYALTVVSDEGYGEVERPVGELPGVVKVRRWAKVRGKLAQAGKPIADWKVQLWPLRDQGGDAPRGNVVFYSTTDLDGSFLFDRVPPVACRVKGNLHWSVKAPLSSSRSLPIAPVPGEELTVSLGGGGAELTGKLALDPPAADFDYHFGLNYLVARRPGVTPPAVANKGFDWRKGWSDAWTNSQEGGAYLQTLDHYFVKPEPDGRIRISGVEPGEYDLAVHLYGSTEGCLVHPVGVTVVRVTVPEGQSAVDLGTIKVPALPDLKVGDAAPAFEFTDIDGQRLTLAGMRGKFVLVDFWATWCGPCVAKIANVESLRQKHAGDLGLIVVGANLDQDLQRAKDFLRDQKLPWEHALLGDWSSTQVPKRFAVSSVPTYVLIGPDGGVLAHESSLGAIAAILDKAAVR